MGEVVTCSLRSGNLLARRFSGFLFRVGTRWLAVCTRLRSLPPLPFSSAWRRPPPIIWRRFARLLFSYVSLSLSLSLPRFLSFSLSFLAKRCAHRVTVFWLCFCFGTFHYRVSPVSRVCFCFFLNGVLTVRVHFGALYRLGYGIEKEIPWGSTLFFWELHSFWPVSWPKKCHRVLPIFREPRWFLAPAWVLREEKSKSVCVFPVFCFSFQRCITVILSREWFASFISPLVKIKVAALFSVSGFDWLMPGLVGSYFLFELHSIVLGNVLCAHSFGLFVFFLLARFSMFLTGFGRPMVGSLSSSGRF